MAFAIVLGSAWLLGAGFFGYHAINEGRFTGPQSWRANRRTAALVIAWPATVAYCVYVFRAVLKEAGKA